MKKHFFHSLTVHQAKKPLALPLGHLKSSSIHKISSQNSSNFSLIPKTLPISQCENPSIQENLGLASEYYEQGDYDMAINLYKQVMKADSLCNIAVVNISACMLMKEMYNSALEILKTVCLKKHEYYAGCYNKILALIRLKAFKKAGKIIGCILDLSDQIDKLSVLSLKHLCDTARTSNTRKTCKKLTKKPTLLTFPYLQAHEQQIETQSSIRKLQKTSTFHKSPSITKQFSSSKTLPKALKSISTAYSNFISTSKRKVTKVQTVFSPKNLFQEEQFVSSTFSKASPSKKSEIKTQIEEKELVLPDERDITERIVHPNLSVQSLNEISFEYFKPPASRNYEKLAARLGKIGFFAKFSEKVLLEVVKKAELRSFTPKEIIIEQGDIGDFMYIILSGTVSIMKKSEEYGNFNVQINSMYPGDTFGEMALLASTSIEDSVKRSATCISDQNTLAIAISKAEYKHILLDMMHNDIHGKANFFSTLAIFQGTDNYNLIPLAANVEPISFKINEIILEAGDLPQGLYIIYTGRCSVLWEAFLLKKKKGSKVLSKAPRGYLSERTYEAKKTVSRKISTQKIDLFDSKELGRAERFLQTEMLSELIKGYDLHKKCIEVQKIKAKDFFGSRAILKQEVKTPAKFSIIADSSEVKIFVLKNKHFALLPENCLV